MHEAIFDRFVDAFAEVVGAYRTGDPEDEQTDIGPLARAAQLDVLDAQVADAVAKGARVVCRRAADRTTGIVVRADSSRRRRSEHERHARRDLRAGHRRAARARRRRSLRGLDDTEFGLGAAVFSRDRERAERILVRLDVGNAYWNRSDRSSVTLPWAGRRHSGLGVSMSESGVRAFVREKAWHLGS